METMYYIGLDVHKKTISYCVKDGGGGIYAEGSINTSLSGGCLAATLNNCDRWRHSCPSKRPKK